MNFVTEKCPWKSLWQDGLTVWVLLAVRNESMQS